MGIRVTADVLGAGHLIRSLANMADEKGRKWKRQSFIKAGYRAFRPVVYKARNLAPRRTGKLRRNIESTRGNYNMTAKGKVRKGKHEYHIATTLKKTWDDRRYPFMLEAGIPAGSWERKAHFRNGHLVKSHTYTRTRPYSADAFQSRALSQSKTQVVRIFKTDLGKYIDKYAGTQYKTLRSALNADKRKLRQQRRKSKK
ncbi:hypothetical protein [Shewanella sp. SE1]|uniref:hypothetical protein n=1 Tax=Shewanella sp. SE1 TaxID=2705014 RepID=UPI00138F58D1|nr:hypothetical protein [Shewanella sp. SE1]NDO73070.1 hypothetical protein [Shewanella sp. SE1]